MKNEISGYVGVKALQQALGLSRSGIYQLCKSGVLPSGIRIGRAHRWSVSEINSWLRRRGNLGKSESDGRLTDSALEVP